MDSTLSWSNWGLEVGWINQVGLREPCAGLSLFWASFDELYQRCFATQFVSPSVVIHQLHQPRLTIQSPEGQPVPFSQHQVELGVAPPQPLPVASGEQQPEHLVGTDTAVLITHH